MRYFIIAGEASGDLHGSNLIKAILQKDPEATIAFWGGDLMQEAAKTAPLKHYKALAFMGFVEVVANLRTILGNMKTCKKQIADFNPDVIVMIDYPGFNMPIAKWGKKQGYKIAWYISPQIWAWKQNRVHALKRDVDEMLVILPFEKDFYANFGAEVKFVGHPLLDAINDYQKPSVEEVLGEADPRPIVALLPGSRKQEISKILPEMLSVVPAHPEFRFVVAGAPSRDESDYKTHIGTLPVEIAWGKTYGLLSIADAALVTSGTATLETALFEVPEVVCYKGNPLSITIARFLLKIKYISLVNLIVDRLLVTELIQGDLNKKRLDKELMLLFDEHHRQNMLNDYRALKSILGGSGASERAAQVIIELAAR